MAAIQKIQINGTSYDVVTDTYSSTSTVGMSGQAVASATNASIAKSIGTTAGDIIYWSAASTPKRLAKGSSGQALTINSSGVPAWATISVSGSTNNTSKMYLVGATSQANSATTYSNTKVYATNGALYGDTVHGAVYNDYAEYRKSDVLEAGRVVIENGDGTLSLATERLQRGAEIISDTFGFSIGETSECKTPVAVAGRVLAYPYERIEEYKDKIGYPVCSGPNGTISLMTDEEELKYPSRIIGVVSEIPNYTEWGTNQIQVDGRIWIKLK